MNLIKTMKFFITVFVASILFCACSGSSPEKETPKEIETSSSKPLPAVAVQAIKTKFPDAVPYQQGIDSILNHLQTIWDPA
jgi:hypothetical protein